MHPKTIEYYDVNAQRFISSTVRANMRPLLSEFLKLVPDGGRVLDWGCGSGRDTLAMASAGYDVVPSDLSDAMADATEALTGIAVRRESFSDLDDEEVFDGIWASASLLHARSSELPDILSKATRALRADGVLYVSFKLGNFEGERNGRWFNDMDESALREIIARVDALMIERVWTSVDVRAERRDEMWLNAILRKDTTQLRREYSLSKNSELAKRSITSIDESMKERASAHPGQAAAMKFAVRL